MSAARTRVHDLVTLQALDDAIAARVEVAHAQRELAAAKVVGISTRVGLARMRVDAAASLQAASRSSLEAAIAIEVESRS